MLTSGFTIFPSGAFSHVVSPLFMIANVILIPFLKKYSAVFYFILFYAAAVEGCLVEAGVAQMFGIAGRKLVGA